MIRLEWLTTRLVWSHKLHVTHVAISLISYCQIQVTVWVSNDDTLHSRLRTAFVLTTRSMLCIPWTLSVVLSGIPLLLSSVQFWPQPLPITWKIFMCHWLTSPTYLSCCTTTYTLLSDIYCIINFYVNFSPPSVSSSTSPGDAGFRSSWSPPHSWGRLQPHPSQPTLLPPPTHQWVLRTMIVLSETLCHLSTVGLCDNRILSR